MQIAKEKKEPRALLSVMPYEWKAILKKLFNSVGIILITQVSRQKGAWKLGKTDLGLFLSECLLELGVVSEVATNINTYGAYPQVSDLISLRKWLYHNNRRKLYIFDELNVHAYRRRAMSNKNIGILQIFPEISKARARLIGIAQDVLSIDKDFTKDIWTRGLFVKRTLKNLDIYSLLLPKSFHFKGIPRTSIKFDPYEVAPFMERPILSDMIKDENLRNVYLWCKGKLTWRDLYDHPQKFSRFIKREILAILEKHFTTHNSSV